MSAVMINPTEICASATAYMAPVRRAQIDNLYHETLLLVDDAQQALADCRDALSRARDPEFAVAAMTEAMLTTSRLTHVMAWLLHQRAIIAEDPSAQVGDIATVLDEVTAADWTICHNLPPAMRNAVAASERLMERLILLDSLWSAPPADVPPVMMSVHHLMDQLRTRL
jgi:regulator of CtrA degradation